MAEFSYTPAQKAALKLISGSAGNIMLFGGSRSGKTFLICCAIVIRALRSPGSRHAVIRRYSNAVRSAIGADTIPKVLQCRFCRQIDCEYRKTEGVFSFPNGAEIVLTGLDDPAHADKILGKEFATIYFNECSELDFQVVQTALTRLAQNSPPLHNKALFDCNPPDKSHWTYRVFIEKSNPLDNLPLRNPENYVSMRINPVDNAQNLPPGYIENTLAGLPRRQRMRFLEGNFQDTVENALWQRRMIDDARVESLPELMRTVIGVDPAVSGNAGSDCTGIIVAARGVDGEYYILADRSVRGTPLEWGNAVIRAYYEFDADRIIGEVNNGGDLIEMMLRKMEPDISFKAVRATKGKLIRAEPVAALYEKKKVHHHGEFPLLEDELLNYSSSDNSKSPDRLDALVWAVTELSDSGRRFILAG